MMKERIKHSAHGLFLQYGIRSVSMDDIAATVGCSKKTLYHHFTQKDSLVDEVVGDMLTQNCRHIQQDATVAKDALHEAFAGMEHSSEIFKTMNPAIMYDLHKYHAAAFNRFIKFKNDFLLSIIKANLERGVAEGLYRAGMDIDIIANFRLQSMFIPFTPEFFNNINTNLSVIQHELFFHFIYGIATLKGHKLIAKYQKQTQL